MRLCEDVQSDGRAQKAKKSNFLPEKQQNDRQREGKDLVVIFYQKSMQKRDFKEYTRGAHTDTDVFMCTDRDAVRTQSATATAHSSTEGKLAALAQLLDAGL